MSRETNKISRGKIPGDNNPKNMPSSAKKLPTKELPIGIQDFEKLIQENYLYVDKTQLLYSLIKQGEVYFLSRPRRFGKSLLISTMQALFEGKRELFKDLWIDDSDYDWTTYPVIPIDLSEIPSESAEQFAKDLIQDQLLPVAQRYSVELDTDVSPPIALKRLIIALAAQHGPVVVLVDEYDKPILNCIGSYPEKTQAVRDALKDFYTILKSQNANLRFVFLTGITKFSRVSIFSGLNNLNDISMDAAYANLLGYTEQELVNYFAPWISRLANKIGLDENSILEKIKAWYNGYAFSPELDRVYNPFSTLLLCQKLIFKTHWFETGTPTFLMKLIEEKNFELSGLEIYTTDAEEFNTFTPEQMTVTPILYQAGYLTIKSYDELDQLYTLCYPNYEIKQGFVRHLLKHLIQAGDNVDIHYAVKMRRAIRAGNIEEMIQHFNEFLTKIPYPVHLEKEAYYQSLFYAALTYSGITAEAETITHRGRIDILIERGSRLWIIECKINQDAKTAMQQIHAREYMARYKNSDKDITLVGMNFSTQTRQVDDWLIEAYRQSYIALTVGEQDRLKSAERGTAESSSLLTKVNITQAPGKSRGLVGNQPTYSERFLS